MKKFDSQLAPGIYATRKTPDQMNNAAKAPGVTLAWGVVGLILGWTVILGINALGGNVPKAAAWLFAGIYMLVTSIIYILKSIGLDLITTIETITRHDINEDGVIGLPSTTVELHDDSRPQDTSFRIFPDIPCTDKLLFAWGMAALNGESLSFESWQYRFALLPDGSDGKENYRRFRTRMHKMGWAREQGTHSIKPTPEGIHVFRLWQERGAVQPVKQLIEAER